MTELWSNIEGFTGYAVSTHGRVKSLVRRVAHPRGGTRLLSQRILKPHPSKRGYLHVSLRRDGKTLNRDIHRLVATAFILNPYALPEVDHEDKDKAHNQVENLSWVTRLTNAPKGEEHAHVLTTDQVEYIRYHLSWGATQSDLAGLFGVSQGTISKIKRNKLWRA